MNYLTGVALAFSLGTLAASLGGEEVDGRQWKQSEKTLVQDLAEKGLKDKGLWKGKIVLTASEVLLDHAVAPAARHALLTYYRYEGDLGIIVGINLDKKTVTEVQEHAHLPTSLTSEEIAEAGRMARASAPVQKALANYRHLDKIEFDPVVAYIINPDVPGYHHRVARLFFRDSQGNYLQLVPMVDVDLTTGEVRLDVIAGAHDKN
jgi:hypothetical protein